MKTLLPIQLLFALALLLLRIDSVQTKITLATLPEPLKPTCLHSFRIFNDLSGRKFMGLRITTMEGDVIENANAPLGYATGAAYPTSVTWSIHGMPFIPKGGPIDGEFNLFMRPRYDGTHQLNLEWLGKDDSVLCHQTIEVACKKDMIVAYKDQELVKRIHELVSFDDNMLIFTSKQALRQIYYYLSAYCKTWQEVHSSSQTNSQASSLLDFFEHQFEGFESYRKFSTFQDKVNPDWVFGEIMSALLNKNAALKINQTIYIFKGSNQLFEIPPFAEQAVSLQAILVQSEVKIMDSAVVYYDLLNGWVIQNNFQDSIRKVQNLFDSNRTVASSCDSISLQPTAIPIDLQKRDQCSASFSYRYIGERNYLFYNLAWGRDGIPTQYTWQVHEGKNLVGSKKTYGAENFVFTFPHSGVFNVSMFYGCSIGKDVSWPSFSETIVVGAKK